MNKIVVERYDYYPFGLVSRSSVSSDIETIQKFTGKELDDEHGVELYYFGARYHDPVTGRFMSVDPLADVRPWESPYIYCTNNPLINIDPTGEEWYQVWEEYKNDDGKTKKRQVWEWRDEEESEVWTGKYDNDGNKVMQTVQGKKGGFLVDEGEKTLILGKDASKTVVEITLGVMPLTPGDISGIRSIWSATKKLSSVKNSYKHWIKHGREFKGLQNAKQYVDAARKFINSPPKGTLTKLKANGDRLYYHPASNTFAVKSASGTPRTMFKPDEGMQYWLKQ